MLFLGQIVGELPATRPTTKAWPITRPNLVPSEKAFFGKVLYRMGHSLHGLLLRATGHVPAVHGSGGATGDAVARQVDAERTVVIFIRDLARESEGRIGLVLAVAAGALPAPAWPVGAR
jgi:hypothetical protein